ncbi:hypothetical protein GN956_G4669 [Arapaima gigas]
MYTINKTGRHADSEHARRPSEYHKRGAGVERTGLRGDERLVLNTNKQKRRESRGRGGKGSSLLLAGSDFRTEFVCVSE